MTRLLFWLGLVVLVIMALRSKARSIARPPAPPTGATGQAEAMASCAHCGIYFPASESVRADGLDYCCPAHVRLPPR